MRHRKLIISALLILWPVVSAWASMKDVDNFLTLANQRFEFMHAIAAAKFELHYPIDLSVPERVALRKIYNYAHTKDINLHTLRHVMQVAVVVGKRLQAAWFSQWRQQGFIKNYKVKDLKATLLPILVKQDEKMIDALAAAIPTIMDKDNQQAIKKSAKKLLTAKYLSNKMRMSFINALMQIKPKKVSLD